MHNRWIYWLIIIVILSSTNVFGQKRTFSPYSRYGIGEMHQTGFSQVAGLDNTGIAVKSAEHINHLNPASYCSLDTLSFFLEAGVRGFNQNFESSNSSTDFNDINFDYFAISFPLSGKVYTSIGVLPFSNTGYNITNNNASSDLGNQESLAIGSGNISKIYMGLSVEPVKNLSIGAHASFLFGNLRNLNYISNLDNEADRKHAKLTEVHVSDLVFDFGLQYQLDLNTQHSIIFGAVCTPKTAIRGDRSTFTAIVSSNNVETEGTITISGDTLSYTDEKFTKNTFELPLSYGFGLTYQIKDKLIWTTDYNTTKWANANSFFKDPSGFVHATDSWRLSSGIEYIPKDRDSKNYLKRIRYRVGSHYMKDYLMSGETEFLDIGMSFGIGLPLKRSRSSVNLGVQYGRKGTKDNVNLRENYTRITLNIALHEYWFIKQKFD